ncbi:PDZ domain-containing protein, partial [Butyricicoccus sp. 1XD8-22]
MVDILIEFGLGITRLFINPLFYIAIAMSVYLGYRRVKRERRNFHIRILSGWSELSGLFKEGLLLSLSISLLSLAIGLTVPIQLLFMVTIISVVALVTYFFHLLSPIIYITISIGLLMVMGMQNWSFNLFGLEFMGVNVEEGAAVTISILVGLLLIAEGILIRQNGALYASPIVEKTKRGMKAVAFLSKKVWVLPIFLVIPGDAIQAYFPFWPQFSLGTNEF